MTKPDADLLQSIEQLLEHSRRFAVVVEQLVTAMENDKHLSDQTLEEYRQQVTNAAEHRDKIDAMVKALWQMHGQSQAH